MSQLVLREVDEAKNPTAVFVYSDQRHIPGLGPTPARVDISVSEVSTTGHERLSDRIRSRVGVYAMDGNRWIPHDSYYCSSTAVEDIRLWI